MKKIILFSAIALSAITANAQVSVKDSIAAAKQAMKELKAKQAADLKEFKAKQAKELKTFVESQKKLLANGGKLIVDVPTLSNTADSLAYYFGVAQSRGLDQYVYGQLQVKKEHVNDFVKGVMVTAANGSADTSNKDEQAYKTGVEIGERVEKMTADLSKQYFEKTPEKLLNLEIVASGLMQGMLGQNTISSDSANTMLQDIMYGENRRTGEKFLAENKKKAGVVTLPSGLQYKVLVEGDKNSERAKKADKVKVNYEGRLIDGTVFDSSYKRNKPATFQPNQVIPGWTEALTLMPVGSTWELYIPYQLGYGERGQGRDIKPYSTLIFKVELLENETVTAEAKKKAEEAAATPAPTEAKKSAKTSKK